MELHIVSGFLGAGKTTFLNRYLPLLPGKTVVIENEAGAIGIDGTLLPGDFPVRELSAGCICCTLAGELHKELALIAHKFKPDWVVMEPSGIGALSDIMKHCESAGVDVGRSIVLVDASAFWNYLKGFGHFFLDQISKADVLLLSHLGDTTREERQAIVEEMRKYNPLAVAYLDDWRDLDDDALMALLACDASATGAPDPAAAAHAAPIPSKDHDFSTLLLKGLAPWDSEKAEQIVSALQSKSYGTILRVKGFFSDKRGNRFYFGYTPTDWETRKADSEDDYNEDSAVIIGCDLQNNELRKLFDAQQAL